MLTTPYLTENVEQQELAFMAEGMQNGAATVEGSVALAYKNHIHS